MAGDHVAAVRASGGAGGHPAIIVLGTRCMFFKFGGHRVLLRVGPLSTQRSRRKPLSHLTSTWVSLELLGAG